MSRAVVSIYALVFAIVACFATTAFAQVSKEGIAQCRVNTVKGFHVDVNPLKKLGSGPQGSAYSEYDRSYTWQFLVNICGAVDEVCEDKKGKRTDNLFSMQQFAGFFGDKECFSLSGTANKPQDYIKLEPVSTKEADSGVVMTITGGAAIEDGPGKGKQRSTEITFICDKNRDTPLFEFIDEDQPTGKYMFRMTTKYACDKEGRVGGSGGGVDWAWFFFFPGIFGFIFLFALAGFAVYMIVGVIINKKKFDRAGIELIPNVEFWRMLPGLWKDGILVIKGAILTIVYKVTKRGGYQDLESS